MEWAREVLYVSKVKSGRENIASPALVLQYHTNSPLNQALLVIFSAARA